jgi:hypothetical protein
MRVILLTPRYIIVSLLLVFLVVLSCPDKDELCQLCLDDVCAYCVYSYPDAQGRCRRPINEIKGCYSYYPDGRCQRCIYGYYRSMEGLCYVLSPKNKKVCAFSLNSYTSCSHCQNFILAKAGKCTGERLCSDPNCSICYIWDRDEACDVCKDGHYLLGDDYKTAKCTLSNIATNGCYYSNSPDYCLDCYAGFYFSNQRCLPTPLTIMPGLNSSHRYFMTILCVIIVILF